MAANQLRGYRSADGGQTWTFDSTPSGTQTGVDREIMWVDHSPTSPFEDRMYVTWHNGNPEFVASRPLGGAWGAPVRVSGAETTGQAIGGDIKTNSAGDVFVFWPDDGGSRGLYLAISTDGGANFGAPINIANYAAFASDRHLYVPSNNSRGARVYISGGAYRTATSNCKTRIWFSRSTNGGAAWSAPVMLNKQVGRNDQFDPRLCVDESNGNLMVIYYDTVNDATRLQTDVWVQTSTDDGQTWSTARVVTSARTDETVAGADMGNQYGDYISLSGFDGNFWPSWTDRRSGGAEEIWTSQLSLDEEEQEEDA